MRIQVDGVPKEQREYFKKNLLNAIDKKGNVYFTLDKAIIEIRQPYLITEESLIETSKQKKIVNTFLKDFRVYQFNRL